MLNSAAETALGKLIVPSTKSFSRENSIPCVVEGYRDCAGIHEPCRTATRLAPAGPSGEKVGRYTKQDGK